MRICSRAGVERRRRPDLILVKGPAGRQVERARQVEQRERLAHGPGVEADREREHEARVVRAALAGHEVILQRNLADIPVARSDLDGIALMASSLRDPCPRALPSTPPQGEP